MITNETIRKVVINKALFPPVTSYAKRVKAGDIASFNTNCEKELDDIRIACAYNSEDPQGFTKANVVQTGKNLFDDSNADCLINAYISSSRVVSDANSTTLFLKCNPSTTYTISKTAGKRFVVCWSETIPENNDVLSGQIVDQQASSITITTGATAKYLVAFVFNSSVDTITKAEMLASIQIEQSATATTYEAYNGTTYEIDFGTTVYGFDLAPITGTGKVIDIDGVESPFTFTPFNITTYNGDNNIFLDLERTSLVVKYLVEKPTEYRYAQQFLPIFYPDTRNNL